MNPHPERDLLKQRLHSRLGEMVSPFSGSVFRFVDPRFSKSADLFAGQGSLHANGRWLGKGSHLAVYTSLEPETALAESLAANRYYGFPDESSAPIVLVTASAKLASVVDLRNGKIRQRLRVSEESILDCDWRMENASHREAMTQALGWALVESGAEGILVGSTAWPNGGNLIVFPENLGKSSYLRVTKEVDWPKP